MSVAPVFKWQMGLVMGLLGALAAVVIGFLTFGVQSTVEPRGVPIALAVPSGAAGQVAGPLAERIGGQGGDAVDWRITDPGQAAELLDDGEVYGVLEIAPAVGGGASIVSTTSGAVNPAGTQVAERVLDRAGSAIAAAIAQRTGATPSVRSETVHPSALAARSFPLSATALLWITGLAANALLLVRASRAGGRVTTGAALAGVCAAAVAGTAVVYGFGELWGLGIAWSIAAIGFLALAGLAFALLQAGVMRLLGLPGVGLLALVYLSAPAVAGQAPELLHPAYRVLLWSWSPVRFSTDTLRSLFFSAGTAPATMVGVWVLVGIAVARLAVLLWPRRGRAAGDSPSAPARAPIAVG